MYKLLMRDEFIRFLNYKNRVALRFRVRCVSAFTEGDLISDQSNSL